MQKISLIVAMDQRGLIGCATGLPWHLPRDLQRFRSLTMGKPIIMGRRTHEQIGRVLPGRTSIVLTHRADFQAPGCVIAHSVEGALEEAQRTSADEAMVIGGAEVYRLFLPLYRRMYVTVVEGSFEGNTWFPGRLPSSPEWVLVHTESFPADDRNKLAHRFMIYDRVQ